MPGHSKHHFFVYTSKKSLPVLPTNFFSLNRTISKSLSDLKNTVDNLDKFLNKLSAYQLFEQVPMNGRTIHDLAKPLNPEYQALCYAIFVIYLKHSAPPLSDIEQVSLEHFKEKYQSTFDKIRTSKLKMSYEIDEAQWQTLHAYRNIIVLAGSMMSFYGHKLLLMNIAGLLVDNQLASLGGGANIFNQLRVAIYEGEGNITALKRQSHLHRKAALVLTRPQLDKQSSKKRKIVDPTSINHSDSSSVETSMLSNSSVYEIKPPIFSKVRSDEEVSPNDVFEDESLCSNLSLFFNNLPKLKTIRDDDSAVSELSLGFNEG